MRNILLMWVLALCLVLNGCTSMLTPTCPRPSWPQQPQYPLQTLTPRANDATVAKALVATVYGQQQFINGQLRPYFKD